MWAIMKQFNVLPNDERLLSLTTGQLNYIISSMVLDVKEQEELVKGLDPDKHYEDSDFEWEGELILPQGEEADDIMSQVRGIKERLLAKRDAGETLTPDEQRSVEAYDLVKVKLEEAKEKELEARKTGNSLEDINLKSSLSEDEYERITSTDKIKSIENLVNQEEELDEDDQAMQDILASFDGDFN